MNKIMVHAVGAAVLLITSATQAEPIRAGYEVLLTKGDDTWRANTVAPLEVGRPIQQGLGPYVVSMNVTEEKGDAYTLLVRITGQPGSATETSEFIRKSFDGDHKQQLEFAASESGLAVKGVIFVGSPRTAAQ